jgi:hypothetical protein
MIAAPFLSSVHDEGSTGYLATQLVVQC